ncbi:MAG: Translation initiation factor 1, partial [uncultured Nocardioidaceae bacterium]
CRRRKGSSRSRAPLWRLSRTPCSGSSSPTGTRFSPTSAARCASTTSGSFLRTAWWWSSRPTTSPVDASSTATS